MKSTFRRLFREIVKRYPREYGKHSILTRIFFPYLAPTPDESEVVKLYNGMKIRLHPAEYLQGFLYNFGGYEFPSLRFIAKAVRPGDTVLDIGAQIGFMSLVFAKHAGPSGAVFAFEPEPRNFAALQENIALNDLKNVTPMNIAVTDVEQTLRLFIGKGENTGVHSTLFNTRTMSSDFVDVPGSPIDRVVEQQHIARVDFVKIDIEGAELAALKGMKGVLAKDSPLLLVEIAAELQNLGGISVRHFKETLANEYGYAPYTIDEAGSLHASPLTAFHLNDNVVFIPEARKSEFHHLIRAEA